MCDESQDPLQKISRQLSELASAQQSGHLVPEVEDSQWTQFSGIPSHAGPPPFPNLYPWNLVTVSSSSTTDTPVDHHAVYKTNDSLRNNLPSFQNGSSQGVHFPWHSEAASYPHQAFQAPADLRGYCPELRSPNTVHSPQPESPVPGYIESSVFQHRTHNPQEVFGYSRDSLSDPNEHYISSGFSGINQSPQPLNLSPSSHFAPVAYNVPRSPSTASQSPGLLEESLPSFLREDSSCTRLPTSPTFESSSPSFTYPAKDFSLGTRSLSLDQTHGTVDCHQPDSKTSVDLDFGYNVDKRSPNTEPEVSSEDDGRQIYAEALNKWLSFDSASASISPTFGIDFQNSSQTFSEPSSPDLSKPSYSDIAKTPKSNQAPVSKQDQPICESFQKNQSFRIPRKDIKTSRPFVRRTSSGSKFWPRGSSGIGVEQPKMPTNSRYGLDSFDDKVLNQVGQNNGSEILSEVARNKKESESSSGAIGALDDITSEMSGHWVTSKGDAPSSAVKEKKTDKMPVVTESEGSTITVDSSTSSSQKRIKKEDETLFFDPRRIFQTKSTSKSRAHSQGSNTSARPADSKLTAQEHIVLNNGKPTASANSSKLPTTARKHDYINNDLRDSSKLTNQAFAAAEVTSTLEMIRQKESKSGSGRRFSGRSNNSSHRERKKSPEKRLQTDGSYEYSANRGVFWSHVDLQKIEAWCGKASEKLSSCCSWLITVLFSLLIYSVGLIVYVSSSVVHLTCVYLGKCWSWLKVKVFGYIGKREGATDWSSQDFPKRRVGLEENIALPTTGEEAMKRLLSCKGKDPYSILGVKADSTDEDIKRYYRKQAVLVHPDKNQEPGAEEAFKILGHAFDMINDPVKRKNYDSNTQEEMDAEAWTAFAEMLSKLQTKIQEAANIMPCDNCGGKHRRFPVDRPFYDARYCEKCNVRHAAKEGDVWAESTMLGFLWHYYALMEGHVYEITEWMKCRQEYFKHMKANDHVVVTRIANGGNKRPRHRGTAEPTMEEIISHLFNQANEAGANRQPPGPESGWSQAGAAHGGAAPSAGSKKSGRRNRKKRT